MLLPLDCTAATPAHFQTYLASCAGIVGSCFGARSQFTDGLPFLVHTLSRWPGCQPGWEASDQLGYSNQFHSQSDSRTSQRAQMGDKHPVQMADDICYHTKIWSSSHHAVRCMSTLSAHAFLPRSQSHVTRYVWGAVFLGEPHSLQAMQARSTSWADCPFPGSGASGFLWGCTVSTVHRGLPAFSLVDMSMYQTRHPQEPGYTEAIRKVGCWHQLCISVTHIWRDFWTLFPNPPRYHECVGLLFLQIDCFPIKTGISWAIPTLLEFSFGTHFFMRGELWHINSCSCSVTLSVCIRMY